MDEMKGKYYAGTSKCDIITLGTSHTLYGIYPQVIGEAGVHGVYNMGGMPKEYRHFIGF